MGGKRLRTEVLLAVAAAPPAPPPSSSTALAALGVLVRDLLADPLLAEWVPDDLPLPENTYAYDNLKPTGGYKRALFVLLRTNTAELTKLVLTAGREA